MGVNYNSKAHKKEVYERAAKVSELLASGLTVKQIQQYAAEKLNWNTTERAIFKYIAKANEIFAQESKAKVAEEFGKGLRRLNMLFASSLKIQDFKACLAIQREINNMLGFTSKQQLVVHGDINQQTNNNQSIATLQLEYVGSMKEIATSEDMVDISRPNFIQLQEVNDSQPTEPGPGIQAESSPQNEQEPTSDTETIRPEPISTVPSIF